MAANTPPPPLPAAFFLVAAAFGFAPQLGFAEVDDTQVFLEDDEVAAFLTGFFFCCLFWADHVLLQADIRKAKASSSSNHPRLFSCRSITNRILLDRKQRTW
jgi:hypothetical protein